MLATAAKSTLLSPIAGATAPLSPAGNANF